MIYLHMDKRYKTDQWYRRFQYQLEQMGAARKNVNLLRTDFQRLAVEPHDALIGRFAHNRRDLRRIRPIFGKLATTFSGRIFPSEITYRYYDDKRLQLEFLTKHAFPTPRGAYVESPSDVEVFLNRTGLQLPLVSKRLFGASSSQVVLANRLDEVLFPGVVQEYFPTTSRLKWDSIRWHTTSFATTKVDGWSWSARTLTSQPPYVIVATTTRCPAVTVATSRASILRISS
jgi:hypothetical protein